MRATVVRVALLLGVAPTAQEPPAGWLDLVESERAFARLSEAEDTRTAFLAFLAEDSVVFEPGPVDARTVYLARQATDDRLEWQPALAGIARAGDLGYTSGPWRFRPAGTAGGEDVHGHYVSVWQTQPDGSWKVVADIGVPHAPPPERDDSVEQASDGLGRDAAVNRSTEVAVLREADGRFSVRASDAGLGAAYGEVLAESARLYRPGVLPMPRAEGIEHLDHLANDGGRWSWTPRGGNVSSSGDLGYTYGTAAREAPSWADAPAERYAYLRIWRWSGGGWRIVIDVTIPAAGREA